MQKISIEQSEAFLLEIKVGGEKIAEVVCMIGDDIKFNRLTGAASVNIITQNRIELDDSNY